MRVASALDSLGPPGGGGGGHDTGPDGLFELELAACAEALAAAGACNTVQELVDPAVCPGESFPGGARGSSPTASPKTDSVPAE